MGGGWGLVRAGSKGDRSSCTAGTYNVQRWRWSPRSRWPSVGPRTQTCAWCHSVGATQEQPPAPPWHDTVSRVCGQLLRQPREISGANQRANGPRAVVMLAQTRLVLALPHAPFLQGAPQVVGCRRRRRDHQLPKRTQRDREHSHKPVSKGGTGVVHRVCVGGGGVGERQGALGLLQVQQNMQ